MLRFRPAPAASRKSQHITSHPTVPQSLPWCSIVGVGGSDGGCVCRVLNDEVSDSDSFMDLFFRAQDI